MRAPLPPHRRAVPPRPVSESAPSVAGNGDGSPGAGRAPRGRAPDPRRRAASGSVPRPWPGGSRERAGSTFTRLVGSGPGGRIVRADVPAPPQGAPRRRSFPSAFLPPVAPRRGPVGPAAGPVPERADGGGSRERDDGEGSDERGGAHPHSADRRAADGRVEGHDPDFTPADGRRHGGLRGAAGKSSSGSPARARGRARDADLQRHGGEGLRTLTAGAPLRQRQLPRRAPAASLAGQRRRRGRG